MAVRAAARAAYLVLCSVLVGGVQTRLRPDPYSQVQARIEGGGDDAIVPFSTNQVRKYLIASFPLLQQVAYVHLPDNVWRPLVVGALASPGAVAVDTQKSRLFVADAPNGIIWWYQLRDSSDGFLQTVGARRAAVEGYAALWMDINSNGDLYFSGHAAGTNGVDAVYRQEAVNIELGSELSPTKVFSRANTGSPTAQAWKPSGIATDSFFVYWANQADGRTHGTIVKGSRDNVGSLTKEMYVTTLNDALDGASGVVTTGTHLFWVAPSGVFGALKNSETKISDAATGLIAPPPPVGRGGSIWNPHGIAWDGDNTLYLTDAAGGIIYSLPALNARMHNISKFTDAPGISDLAVVTFQGFRGEAGARSPVMVPLALLGAGLLFAISPLR